ncbi:MAG: discoidin domain-containing protein [Planctomyces sp.]|nr:discoidin domain-containing protein [Planctomyces sp.]
MICATSGNIRTIVIALLSLIQCFSETTRLNAAERPLKVLLVTGGCCHDYDRQKLILPRGTSARADIEWTVVHQGGSTTDTAIPFYNDQNWAEGFDLVVHNECFADVRDKDFVDRILAPHRNGTPAVLIHCALHCYRVGDDRWFEFAGLQSPGHGPHYSYSAVNLKPDHPIMEGFGPAFVTPKGELYDAVRVFETATPLAAAERQSDGVPQVCVWTNEYRGTRVFGTTIGHYNETMAEPKYLDMLTRGILWAAGRDPQKDFHPTTEVIDESIKALVTAPLADTSVSSDRCCREGNLAHDKLVTFKSQQEGNDARHLVDGRLSTRWCADGAQVNEWIEVDLKDSHPVEGIRIHWEMQQNVAYRYRIDVSRDGKDWTQLINESGNREPNGVAEHQFEPTQMRHVRITYLGTNTGHWGSIRELEVTSGPLPKFDPVAAGGSITADDIQAPDGFDTTVFAGPPAVNYPVCITTSANGEVFVGIDEQGSLGKEAGRGRVVRCRDTDGDGKADQINDFAKMDHPRGLIYDNGSLWVLHPPFFSVFRDTNGDGVSDESKVLIEGISTDEVNQRGADHTTNGIRMGIDGWIYIAVGDFGFTNAIGKDGTRLSRRGGGVVRVRPNGHEMEIFSWGQRNIVDIAIDPRMNIFTRDNTNDGGGWDIRLSHVMQTANYGYPSLYINFSDEIMPPLADYGGGSGCGALYLHDDRWPAPFNSTLLTCDWGRSEVYSHHMPENGPTFDAEQQTFLKIPRPTDADLDCSGRLFVTSWKNGNFSYDGPNIGFVGLITPRGYVPHPTPDLKKLRKQQLLTLITESSAATQLAAQRELLRRFESTPSEDTLTADDAIRQLIQMASSPGTSLSGRTAAVYTIAQIDSPTALSALETLAAAAAHSSEQDATTEAAVRCIADRRGRIQVSVVNVILNALTHHSQRVQAAAIVAAGRCAEVLKEYPEQRDQLAAALLKLSVFHRSKAQPDGDRWRQADPDRVLSHLARKSLADLAAVDICIKALSGPERDGALAALSQRHSPEVVNGLFQVLGTNRDAQLRNAVWTTLIRLYHQEADFVKGWWGTRPDTTGPYYDRAEWSETKRIHEALLTALGERDETLTQHITEQLKRHQISLSENDRPTNQMSAESEKPIVLVKADPLNPNQIGNLGLDVLIDRTVAVPGDPEKGKILFQQQSCIQCHTYANGMLPKGPHLVDIGKRYKRRELIESIVKPSAKIAQGFDTWTFALTSGQVHSGFVVLESAETILIRENTGVSRELMQDEIEERVRQEVSMMPNGIVDSLTPEQLADLLAWLESLK